MGKITVIGMGPGDIGLMSVEAWSTIENAKNIILRTAVHPTAEKLTRRGIKFSSYDEWYDAAESFDTLYESIARDIAERAKRGDDIVYAVPGSPLVAEKTVTLIRDIAGEDGIPLDVIVGLSFVDILLARLGVDPLSGVTVIDAGSLDILPLDWPTGLVVAQVYSREVASRAKLALMESLPDEYEVVFARGLAMPGEEIKKIPLYELDRESVIDHLTSVYVPPVPRGARFDFSPLTDIVRTLRSPGGCPWDIKQTPKSLRRHILEEAYETVEAIDEGEANLLQEELGDLLLQVVFQARMAEEAGRFSMDDVVGAITKKLIRRHPHIFGDVQVTDAAAVLRNWEAIKRGEKPERKSRLDGIPRELPALMTATKLQEKAKDAGFDWDDIAPVWEKCREEWRELSEAAATDDRAHTEEEMGDLLFALVNLSRFLHVDAEVALLSANRKFTRRFSYVERKVNEAGGDWKRFTLAELDGFWEAAKREEAKQQHK